MNNYKNISNRKIKASLVGCGRISENHLKALERYEDAIELVDICDTNLEALERVGKKYPNVNRYTSLSEMLLQSLSDLVILCTPSGLHSRQAVEVATSGRHVITEKPMATRWGDGLKMVEVCDEFNVRLFVVKQNRHNQTLVALKQAIEQKRFGKIYTVAVNVFWTRPQEYYDSAEWRGTWEFDGGAFMNQASHYVDLLDWLVGPVESVMAYTATQSRSIQVEDGGVAALKWRSGALGTLNVTMLTYPSNLEGSITIIGETGTVRIGGVAANKIEHWSFLNAVSSDEQIIDLSYEVSSVYGSGHMHYYQNVINVLQGKSTPFTDGREGLKSLEILIALYLSSRDGKRVSLPLEY